MAEEEALPVKEIGTGVSVYRVLKQIKNEHSIPDVTDPDMIDKNRKVVDLCEKSIDTIGNPITLVSGLITQHSMQNPNLELEEFRNTLQKKYPDIFKALQEQGIRFETDWEPVMRPPNRHNAITAFNQELRGKLGLVRIGQSSSFVSQKFPEISNTLEGGKSRWTLKLNPQDVFDLINEYEARPASENPVQVR